MNQMVASKYLYDEGVDEEVFNDEWADSAKMDTEEVNQIEMNFLSAIVSQVLLIQAQKKVGLNTIAVQFLFDLHLWYCGTYDIVVSICG